MDEVEFPIFLTLVEMRAIIQAGLPGHGNIWHKFNNAICVMETGEYCCDEIT